MPWVIERNAINLRSTRVHLIYPVEKIFVRAQNAVEPCGTVIAALVISAKPTSKNSASTHHVGASDATNASKVEQLMRSNQHTFAIN